jgi:Transposase DDE domain group 1
VEQISTNQGGFRLSDDTTTDCLLFSEIFSQPVVAKFDQRQGSSDGGAILLKAADRRLGWTGALAARLTDLRQAGKVEHEMEELLAQRIYGIACGYADTNDTARLASDPVHKLLAGRDPVAGEDLASQPTLSRFENGRDRRQLFRLSVALADCVIERHRRRLHRRARRITINLDPTDDPTHGAQQLTFFNGHYDTWCYLSVLGFVSFNGEAEQYLVAAVLRPGNAPGARGVVGILRRLPVRLRRAFPRAVIRVRLDGGFATPEVLDFLDSEPGLEYLVNMASNAVLERRARRALGVARRLSRQSRSTEHVYGECRYAAGSWQRKRRVIYKAEVACAESKEPKDNPRFVVTNLEQSAQWIYERVYCPRGEIENRIKELRDGLEIGRTSCTRFFLGQRLPGGADRGRLRAVRGAAAAAGAHALRAGAGDDATPTPVETGGTGGGLGAADRAAPAARLAGRGPVSHPGPEPGRAQRLSFAARLPQHDDDQQQGRGVAERDCTSPKSRPRPSPRHRAEENSSAQGTRSPAVE